MSVILHFRVDVLKTYSFQQKFLSFFKIVVFYREVCRIYALLSLLRFIDPSGVILLVLRLFALIHLYVFGRVAMVFNVLVEVRLGRSLKLRIIRLQIDFKFINFLQLMLITWFFALAFFSSFFLLVDDPLEDRIGFMLILAFIERRIAAVILLLIIVRVDLIVLLEKFVAHFFGLFLINLILHPLQIFFLKFFELFSFVIHVLIWFSFLRCFLSNLWLKITFIFFSLLLTLEVSIEKPWFQVFFDHIWLIIPLYVEFGFWLLFLRIIFMMILALALLILMVSLFILRITILEVLSLIFCSKKTQKYKILTRAADDDGHSVIESN